MSTKGGNKSENVKKRPAATGTGTESNKRKREQKVAFLWPNGNKPLVREEFKPNELSDFIKERDLVNKDKWTEDDHISIANMLVGRSILIDMGAKTGYEGVGAFSDRLEREVLAGASAFEKMLDPDYLLIHTLPDQAHNAEGLFTYKNWPPSHTLASGIEASAGNVPLEWADILHLANTALHKDRGMTPVVPVGENNALIGFAATADFPFFLVFQSLQDRQVVLDYIKRHLDEMFGVEGEMRGWSYSIFSTNTPSTMCQY